eukprot:CAMPEP_0113866988 /NCGR_PEP_ID=MMETSP0780_2-20120614/173_1 /TAXON_ID=652834 /ORGANISM="Palpitomonas bilix" /LENGTH=354 /DNA_ID=CAMNT_0000851889 /DNA_START=289 /DNA_END=1353 /DNA_ORIENTATION=+ /assembly_acc=CAM_ASM_000599
MSMCSAETAVQNWFGAIPFSTDALIWVTRIGDPKYLFTIGLTLCFQLLPFERATRVLLAWSLSDSFNALLKWVFQGDRPFWLCPALHQYEITCESGFGMPSGHTMVSTAAWTAFVLTAPTPRSKMFEMIAVVMWSGLIALSRVYIAAHTVGQVFLGSLLGFAVGAYACSDSLWSLLGGSTTKATLDEPRDFAAAKPKSALPIRSLALRILGGAIICFALLELAFLSFVQGESPDEVSYRRAVVGCTAGQDHVHRSTAPLTAICRDAGALWGLSLLALPMFHERYRLGDEQESGVVKGIRCVISPLLISAAMASFRYIVPQTVSSGVSAVIGFLEFAFMALGMAGPLRIVGAGAA